MVLAEYGDGGWKGCIMISEGREGMGSSSFVTKLCKALVFFYSFTGASNKVLSTLKIIEMGRVLKAPVEALVEAADKRIYAEALVGLGKTQTIQTKAQGHFPYSRG